MKLLLVEDDADNAALFGRLLQRCGHDVRVAADGGEALRRAREDAPEVVLADIGLPGMNGWELAEMLRREPSAKAWILIALTGFDDARARARSLAAGFDAHLVKPVSARAIDRCIQQIRSDRADR